MNNIKHFIARLFVHRPTICLSPDYFDDSFSMQIFPISPKSYYLQLYHDYKIFKHYNEFIAQISFICQLEACKSSKYSLRCVNYKNKHFYMTQTRMSVANESVSRRRTALNVCICDCYYDTVKISMQTGDIVKSNVCT